LLIHTEGGIGGFLEKLKQLAQQHPHPLTCDAPDCKIYYSERGASGQFCTPKF
jgi:hypothetical protein